ncbi:MAG: AP2 domain-containing protein [Candidatus Paceibacterota bacterium]|jgi:hypothetical protein
MKEILLTQGKVALVDDEDFKRLNRYKWYAAKMGDTFYALRAIIVNKKQIIHRMHWSIMKGKGVDHIYHNGLDNQKDNLRFCTKSQNGMNRKPNRNSKSPYKGAQWDKVQNKWRCAIVVNKKSIYLGVYVNDIDAAKAYDKAAKKYFGEFAYINFPE